ncbi:uncharacterized protein ColSpa_08423 [Colletotrichum spaethianum]|uniref:BTB domain-containing protein n=1 Tax=Colletotrichum spaethianum TaxID=700344 RepID=A0AA37UQ72_9PEZI|nr:uncharacterized protein ColSpa_08423 [Colletotrichum spaethianum]GKT48242.1 hypothetical protein ColSpa_08423 [Colletotrichum spaethianum]
MSTSSENNTSSEGRKEIGGEQDSDLTSITDIAVDKGSLRRFVVCSKTLAQASHIFDAMLFGDFAEAQHHPNHSWVVRLPADSPEVMHIILTVAHDHLEDLPSTMSVTELVEPLVQADKYEMTHLLGRWLPKWFDQKMDVGACDDKRGLAWLAREIGAATVFKRLAVNLGYDCRLKWDAENGGWKRPFQ